MRCVDEEKRPTTQRLLGETETIERRNTVKAAFDGGELLIILYRDLIHFGLVAMRSESLVTSHSCQPTPKMELFNYQSRIHLVSLIETSVLLSWLQVIERMNGIGVEYANETLFTRSLRHLVTRGLVWWTKSIVCSCCRLF